MTVNPTGPVDAVFHLLDRQIIDREGMLVAKVDDLELAEYADGRLAVAALLCGPGALGPRLGGRLGRWTVAIWRRLHPDADPDPRRVPVDALTRLDSAVRIAALGRELGLDAVRQWVDTYVISRLPGAGAPASADDPGPPYEPPAAAPDGPPPVLRRLADLIGARALDPDGRLLGHVNDVRVLVPLPRPTRVPVVGLIVDNRPATTRLGYERRTRQGPALLRAAVRSLHRTAGYAPWSAVEAIDWQERTVRLQLRSLDRLPG